MQQSNNSVGAFRNGQIGGQVQEVTPGDSMGTNGDQYFSATFNALGIQDFPPFRGGPRPRSSMGTLHPVAAKQFGSTSGMDQMPDDFAALNLAVGPLHNKGHNIMTEFEPKSPGLPHSSSTSSFASYASMFGQSPVTTVANSGHFIPNSTALPASGASVHNSLFHQGIANPSPLPPTSAPTHNSLFHPGPHGPLGSTPGAHNLAPVFGASPQNVSAAAPNPVSMFGPNLQSSAPVSANPVSTNGLVYTSAVSPVHSPHISPVNSPLSGRRLQSPNLPSLRQVTIPHKSASSSLVQESVGGTTYFYHPDDFKPQNEGPQLSLPSFCVYPAMPAHVVHLRMKSSVPQYFAPDELKMDILNRHVLTMMQTDPASPIGVDLPSEVDNYQNLCPLERIGPSKPSIGNLPSTTYKALCTKDGLYYCLRRIHGFRLAGTKFTSIIENWKKLYHPNVVMLKEVFTTKSFNDNSIVFVYDYHAGAETLMSSLFSPHHINGYSQHSHHPFSREHGKSNNTQRSVNSSLLPESLIWTYIVQLSSALRAIHSANLAVRSLDLNRIIVTGKARLRINCAGILDVITTENSAATQNINAYKQEDLTAMGKIILALACNSLMCVQRDGIQSAVDLVQRNYSPDLKNLICYLLQNPSRVRSINDVMPMIGARFFTQLDTAHLRSDVIENELAKEIENGRLFRIMVKLGCINERPEYNSEPSWAETGDRFMLKLFRDYLFHQVDDRGVPWVDMAHVIQCLNK
ncbi:unnamed protein product, partial [Candidula unifasciata]